MKRKRRWRLTLWHRCPCRLKWGIHKRCRAIWRVTNAWAGK